MFTQICRMLIIITLAIAPLSVFAADSPTTSAAQQGVAETEDEPACTYPAVETAGQTLQSQEINSACDAQSLSETHILTEVVTITQTVFLTEVVRIEQIVPVTETVLVTEVVTVEQIVPVTETVFVTEVVTVEQIVPVTQTVLVTEVVTVEPTVPMSETESAAPSPTASVDSIEETPDSGELEESDSPESAVTTSNPDDAQAQTTNGQPPIASKQATHWLQLSPPYSEPTPLPITGLAMYYAPQVMDRVERYRERVNKIEACEECIGRVALLRAGDLGRLVWIQVGKGKIEGPFQVLDVAARHHIPDLLRRNWVVDVDYETAKRWGMRGPIEVTIYAEPPEKLALQMPKTEQPTNP